MCERYEILDPRPNALEAPYTFYIPPEELIMAVKKGDLVKAIIKAVPPSKEYDAERMWVLVNSTDIDWLEGTLESDPLDMPLLPKGSKIRLPKSHIIDVILDNPQSYPNLPKEEEKREYWERCLVEQCILDGELKVEYLYREEADITQEGDKYPDSGWRIRGDMRNVTSDELDKREIAYVALGAVLNKDDSWLHLIDEPVGSAFEKDYETNVFVKYLGS